MGEKEERRRRRGGEKGEKRLYSPSVYQPVTAQKCGSATVCSPCIVNGSVPLQLVPCSAKAVMNTCGNCIVY